MNQIKTDRSKSYREFLLSSLKDIEHSAGYIEAALEERDPDPTFLAKLLKSVIQDVVVAKYSGLVPQVVQEKLEQFNQSSDVYDFVELIDTLGFEIAIRPKE